MDSSLPAILTKKFQGKHLELFNTCVTLLQVLFSRRLTPLESPLLQMYAVRIFVHCKINSTCSLVLTATFSMLSVVNKKKPRLCWRLRRCVSLFLKL